MQIDITKEQWIKIREQGKFKYILFHWIITVALPLGVVLPVFRIFFNSDYTFSRFITNVMINIVMFSFVSIIFGNWKWKKYSKMLN
ncbi:hypothetical protein CTER_3736 [Ruminiclostridium cellobioparum subsp. termitidis CT1112]|uniref:Uncharacterized protein n=1 Tax=Ruminiclostridium cellobioparum subsp. termitidis CT1112 TaxID=1195236 RepID=S0FGD4_RUMCE|nr:hypothetical protein CTER_3736 [Ruminiclostridium cellobioparum subsp. termitidis CT1112]